MLPLSPVSCSRLLLGTGTEDDCKAALNGHFDFQFNSDFERFKLRRAYQREGQRIDNVYAYLREVASMCMADDQSKEVLAQLIQKWSKLLRGLILRQPGISVDDILIMAWSYDLSAARVARMESVLTTGPNTGKQPTIKPETVGVIMTQGGRVRPPDQATSAHC
ncbi:hypothetical protein NDU88_002001 [Pleurodeles waltl]|uniref:Uncharacterized protein n=1 Tax=Pleurodeles waltl TaxID=8319 RepID=A0AAV7UC05_PLEWA|nr:hypothetical protein NDU88_002001 [Pleurodeles waltl]